MKRRRFIQSVAGAGLAWTASPAALAQEIEARRRRTIAANERIQVALIGARNMGGKSHLPTLLHDGDCHLCAVCDVDRGVQAEALQKARAAYTENDAVAGDGGVRGCGDFREVLERDDVDAVVIATPDHWHVPLARAAIRAGKAVYVEKPLSLYILEGRALADLTAERKAVVQVGSQHRSQDRFMLATAAARSGMLGEIRHVEVAIPTRAGQGQPWEPQPVPAALDYEMWVGPAPWSEYHPRRVHYDFRFVPDFSGGDVTNWGAHYLDSAQQILGTDYSGPVSVEGRGSRHPAGSLHTTFFDIDVDYTYANGVTLKLRSGGDGEAGVTVRGSEASLFVNRGALTLDPPELKRSLPKAAAAAIRKTPGSHMSNWLACIRSGRAQDLHAPIEVGHRSATLCHLANLAMELGRPLTWQPQRERFYDDAHANALLDRPVRDPWRI